jgi:hypothetical protein
VVIPENDLGQIDDFIDDGIAIVPDLGKNSIRAIQALLLAVHILFRPTDLKGPVLRDDCLSLGKLLEEGFLTETPVILGWQINTRALTIQLPDKKFKCWSQELSETILTKMISFKDLEKLIGQLNHAASACPIMRYFLNHLRRMLQNWESKKQTKKSQEMYL